jgi:hypothetical protein
MNRWSYMVWIVLLTGCASGHMYPYPYPTSPFAERSPIRYPLDYPICYTPSDTGTLFVPLHIRISGAGIPDPMRVMSLREKDPLADGCSIYEERRKKRPGPYVVMTDSHYALSSSGWQSLDLSGQGYFSATAYKYSLLNADDLHKEAEHEQKVAQYRVQNLEKFGETSVDVVKQDEAIVINGLKWRHRLVAHYITPDLETPSVGRLTGWRDIYEHQVDGTHVLRRIGRYDAMVVADPEWIEARRELTKKLVEAVRIEKITQAEVDAAVAEYNRQREKERNGSGAR